VPLVVVGVGDCRVVAEPSSELVTYALGSCLAVAIWDPLARAGGLLHFMLPSTPREAGPRPGDTPYRYADTGIPLLFREAYEHGAQKHRLLVRIAGGAHVMNESRSFGIGKQNLAAARGLLQRARVPIACEAVGGTKSRTLRMQVGTGRLWISSPGEPDFELVG
jgi:chemotaxis protein CheD